MGKKGRNVSEGEKSPRVRHEADMPWIDEFLNGNYKYLVLILIVGLLVTVGNMGLDFSVPPPPGVQAGGGTSGKANPTMPKYQKPGTMSALDERQKEEARRKKDGLAGGSSVPLEEDDDKFGHQEATRLGMEASRGGTTAEALGYFQIAYDMHQSTFSAMNLGVSYMRSNRLNEALEMFKASQQLDTRQENKDLAENFRAIQQHLDYREGRRSSEDIAKESKQINVDIAMRKAGEQVGW